MYRFYDVKCLKCGDVFEYMSKGHKTIGSTFEDTCCQGFDKVTLQVLPCTPVAQLEGITGDFPGAYSQWEKKHYERQAQFRKREENHGPQG